MSLTVYVNPNEKIILGPHVLSSAKHTRLTFFTKNVVLLRESEIVRAEDANSICKQVYFVIQSAYAASSSKREPLGIADLVAQLLRQAHCSNSLAHQIHQSVLIEDWGGALSATGKLIQQEVLLSSAQN
ncbi:flagellar biosynthesis repressor FlbT [Rhodoplanes sp. SY1]|uniref:flagellar biosynthesis repressor FlbT n=1 Tax=Rhodoplanes sp. SY1 TaxID=3166646 RepID=UPI0038B5861B